MRKIPTVVLALSSPMGCAFAANVQPVWDGSFFGACAGAGVYFLEYDVGCSLDFGLYESISIGYRSLKAVHLKSPAYSHHFAIASLRPFSAYSFYVETGLGIARPDPKSEFSSDTGTGWKASGEVRLGNRWQNSNGFTGGLYYFNYATHGRSLSTGALLGFEIGFVY